MLTSDLAFPTDWPLLLAMVGVGAVASGINAVAGGGSLLSFPFLLHIGMPSLVANATNSSALWPGSFAGALGFINLLPKTGHHIKALIGPTILGAVAGSVLLLVTSERVFDFVVPFLILMAALLLVLQPRIKAWAAAKGHAVSPGMGLFIQFLVSLYGGYFGAGMGIMMLAAFALYIEGNTHELNAMKNWLGLAINFMATVLFVVGGKVWFISALALAIGAVAGGFLAAKVSQRVNPDKLRTAIAVYGFATAAYFLWRALG